MEYQIIINLLDDVPNQSSKFRTKNWVKINDNARGTYNTNSHIQFETSMLKSSLCDYIDAYILVKGNITVQNTAGTGQPANNNGREVLFRNCAPTTGCINEVSNTQIYNAKDIDVVAPMYNLTEYSDNYFNGDGVINNLPGNSAMFKFKQI